MPRQKMTLADPHQGYRPLLIQEALQRAARACNVHDIQELHLSYPGHETDTSHAEAMEDVIIALLLPHSREPGTDLTTLSPETIESIRVRIVQELARMFQSSWHVMVYPTYFHLVVLLQDR